MAAERVISDREAVLTRAASDADQRAAEGRARLQALTVRLGEAIADEDDIEARAARDEIARERAAVIEAEQDAEAQRAAVAALAPRRQALHGPLSQAARLVAHERYREAAAKHLADSEVVDGLLEQMTPAVDRLLASAAALDEATKEADGAPDVELGTAFRLSRALAKRFAKLLGSHAGVMTNVRYSPPEDVGIATSPAMRRLKQRAGLDSPPAA
jgi:hypothetical protein